MNKCQSRVERESTRESQSKNARRKMMKKRNKKIKELVSREYVPQYGSYRDFYFFVARYLPYCVRYVVALKVVEILRCLRLPYHVLLVRIYRDGWMSLTVS